MVYKMGLIPKKIYENYLKEKVGKKETVDLLITLIENIEDDIVRKECIDTLNKLDLKSVKVFKILEQILISEPNEDLRYSAAKVIKNKFIKNALNPFLWTLQHESSYDCLITVIKSLEKIGDDRIVSTLINEIKKISWDKMWKWINPLFTQNIIEQSSPDKLVEMLIGLITINNLKNKFDKINYKIESGYINELDFSNVDNQIIYWRDRESLENCSDIIGIKNLKYLRKVEFFSLQWVLKNEFTYKSSIALIEALERLNNITAKNALITQLNKISDKKFSLSIKALLKSHQKIENISLSKLSDILRNYITISFFKNKYPSMEYNVEKGEVISIHIESAPITTIPDFIKHFHSLRSLILKGCRLYNLPESIGSFKHLKVLGLQENNLKAIPKSISSLTSLRILNLSNNKLQKLPYSIGTLSSLRDLNLENNNIANLPSSIGYLESLEKLNAGKNNLKQIPSSISALKSLRSLNLNSNKIEYLTHSIGLLYSLENLNLDNNNLKKIPDSINSVSSLKTLCIEDNKLRILPRSIGLLRSLETLKLGWNKIEKLPISLGSLASLKVLCLNRNKIQKFPESICLLSSLEFLDASRNKIEILPECIDQITSLKILKLSDNQLKKIPDTIGSLHLLEKLNISGNNILRIPKSISSLLSLEEIWLNGNKLKYLPHSIGKLKSLKKLNLNNNQLISLPKSIKNIPSLENISLNSDNIDNVFDYPFISKKLTIESKNELIKQSDSIGELRLLENGKLNDTQLETPPKSRINIRSFESFNSNSDISEIIFDFPIISNKLTIERKNELAYSFLTVK